MRVGHGLLRREGFRRNDEQRLARVQAPQHRRDVVAVDVADEVELQPRRHERRQRTQRHARPEIGAADADVHDMPDAAAGAHVFGEGQRPVEHIVNLVAEGRRTARGPQCRVQHRPSLGHVDRFAGEHGVALGLDAALAGQLDEQPPRSFVPQILRQVGEHFRCLDTEAIEAPADRERKHRASPACDRAPRSGRATQPMPSCDRSAWTPRHPGRTGSSSPHDAAKPRPAPLPAHFSTTWVARSRNRGGNDSPRSRAARALRTSSKRVGS